MSPSAGYRSTRGNARNACSGAIFVSCHFALMTDPSHPLARWTRDGGPTRSFAVGSVDAYLDAFEGDEAFSDHVVECRERCFDLVVGVDAFDDDGEVF